MEKEQINELYNELKNKKTIGTDGSELTEPLDILIHMARLVNHRGDEWHGNWFTFRPRHVKALNWAISQLLKQPLESAAAVDTIPPSVKNTMVS